MADTALPTTDIVSTVNPTATRMGNSGDTSWAGWAISSFTNKMTAARGEMQPSVNGSTSIVVKDSGPASLRAPGRTTAAALISTDKINADRIEQSAAKNNQPTLADQEPDDAFEAWGAMEEDDESFFDAPSSRKRTPSPQASKKYDDEREPDFAGWLAAQSQAKSKKALPKGLSKTSNARPIVADLTMSTPAAGSGSGTKNLLKSTSKPKVMLPVNKLDTKPQESESAEDGWGDDWD
jgi:SCY1-like protein 1